MNLPNYVSRKLRESRMFREFALAFSLATSSGQPSTSEDRIPTPTYIRPDPTGDPYNGLGGTNFGRYSAPLDDHRLL